jgi:uncharacterized membrane protein
VHIPHISCANALLGIVAAAAAVVANGCSSSNTPADASGSACVSSSSCPEEDVPSYKTEIAPILQAACVPCHSPTGTAGFNQTTYADVSSQAGSILSQVAICAMPPLNGPALSSAERIALTAWLRCGAPDN